MAKAINDTEIFARYVRTLEGKVEKMTRDLEILKQAYERADWNDMVSQKVGESLNEYIAHFNVAMSVLQNAIVSLEKMKKNMSEYSD